MGRRKKDDNQRSRNICMILYPDNDRHCDFIKLLEKGTYEAVWVLHDKQLSDDPDGFPTLIGIDDGNAIIDDLKPTKQAKPHWHVVVCFGNARSHDNLSVEWGIERNLIQHCMNVNSYLRYMTHIDYPERALYEVSEFCGSEVRLLEFMRYMEKSIPYEIRFDFLFAYIDDYDGLLPWTVFVRYARDNKKLDMVTRQTFLWKSLVDAHNDEYRVASSLYTKSPFGAESR